MMIIWKQIVVLVAYSVSLGTEVSADEIFKLLFKMPTDKATGRRMLKAGARLSQPIAHIMNLGQQEGILSVLKSIFSTENELTFCDFICYNQRCFNEWLQVFVLCVCDIRMKYRQDRFVMDRYGLWPIAPSIYQFSPSHE